MKTLPRSIALAAATASLVVADAAHSAGTQAQDWPNRPMTMVAPFAAGGSTDAIARIVADGLSSQLHQPVIVENIAGAGGMTGTNRVAKAVPDGYQFVLGNVGTHAQNQSLYKKPLYDAVTDFAPVALITDQSLVLVARNDFPANNLWVAALGVFEVFECKITRCIKIVLLQHDLTSGLTVDQLPNEL